MDIINNAWIVEPKTFKVIHLKKAALFSSAEIRNLVSEDLRKNPDIQYDETDIQRDKKMFTQKCLELKKKYGSLLLTRFYGVLWFDEKEQAEQAAEDASKMRG